MKNKKDSSDPIDNLEYEKVLEEEIIHSYDSKFLKLVNIFVLYKYR